MQHRFLAFLTRLREVLPSRLQLWAAGAQLVVGQLGGALYRTSVPALPPVLPDVLRVRGERMSVLSPSQSLSGHFLLAPEPGAAKIAKRSRAPARSGSELGQILARSRPVLETASVGGGA